MMDDLSPNTQAILLLTAPLMAGRETASADLLSHSEYKRLARHLREIGRQPFDLVSAEMGEVVRLCGPVIDPDRLNRLLSRGFLLSQVLERWRARAIWVISRADPLYPRRLKSRMRDDAPSILYGCGDVALLDAGGLAVVGSRKIDDDIAVYAASVGELSARAGCAVISGGARGVDQSAARGALGRGGQVIEVLAENLDRAALSRENRRYILDGNLLLVSAYDPSASFNVGHAMQRNKLIYALADVSLVVSSEVNKGGTWAGASEQLDKLRYVPVFVRSTGARSVGLEALGAKGALPWPDPEDVPSFRSMIVHWGKRPAPSWKSSDAISLEGSQSSQLAIIKAVQDSSADIPSDVPNTPPCNEVAAVRVPQIDEIVPAEELFATVRGVILKLLSAPLKDVEIAEALKVSNAQAKAWLQRLGEEGLVERQKSARYERKQDLLFH